MASTTTTTNNTVTNTADGTGFSEPLIGYVNLQNEETEDDLRMVVFSECCRSSTTKGLFFHEKRPSHFPAALDIFLWGGLSTRIHEVVKVCASKRQKSFALVMILAYFLIVAPLFWPLTFERLLEFSALAFFIYGALVAMVVFTLWIASRPFLNSLHLSMEAVVQDLAPHFHQVGYNITYEKQEGWFSHLAFIRFTPRHTEGEGVVDQLASTQAVALQRQQRHRFFRVAVYGQHVNPTSCGSDEYSLMQVRPPELGAFVDEFTWGAVMTEIRPLTAQYLQVKSWISLLPMILFYVTVLIPSLFFHRDLGGPWFFPVLLLMVFVPIFYPGSCLETFVLEKCRGQNILEQMQEKVQELAPMVEERSGYELVFSMEKDSCCSTGGFVRFEPSNKFGLGSLDHPTQLQVTMEHV
jgi:hypothetical protein